ncbi:MAG: DUF2782 domain-containing protein [Leptothrix sp. (in: b-proteobacteria)]
MLMRPALACLLLLAATLSMGARSATLVAPDAAQPTDPTEARAEQVVIQDDSSRIEELHVRGEVKRIHVQPRRGAAYEIVPANAGRGPANSPGNSGPGSSSAGQRVWSIFSF